MIRNVLRWLNEPMGRIGVLIAALTVFTLVAFGIFTTQQSPPQPIQFTHQIHIGLGVQCLYCHPGALRGPSPGLPTQTKCWGCHQQIAKTFDPNFPELSEKLVGYIERNEPIPWVPVAQVPDFVHFTHRPHIAAGLNCENCHGDMTQVTVAENPQIFNMGFCLNCHKERTVNDPEKRIKLTDCGTCHY